VQFRKSDLVLNGNQKQIQTKTTTGRTGGAEKNREYFFIGGLLLLQIIITNCHLPSFILDHSPGLLFAGCLINLENLIRSSREA